MATEDFVLGTPTVTDNTDSGQVYTLGREFESSIALPCIGVDWWCPTNLISIQTQSSLYQKADKGQVALSALRTVTNPERGTVLRILFVTPFLLSIGVRYSVGILTDRYAYTAGAGQFPKSSVPNGYMSAPSGVNSRYKETTAGNSVYPDNIHPSGVDYHIAPVLQLPGGGHTKGAEFLTFFQ